MTTLKFKTTRRRETRRAQRPAPQPVRSPVARDMIAFAAALEVLG